MSSFSLSCAVALWVFLWVEPVTKTENTPTQGCLPILCYWNIRPSCSDCTCPLCPITNSINLQCPKNCSNDTIFACGLTGVQQGINVCHLFYHDGTTGCNLRINTCSHKCGESVKQTADCSSKIPTHLFTHMSTSVYSQPASSESAVHNTHTLAPTTTMSLLSYSTITTSSTSNLFTVTNSTSLLTPATMMNSLPYSAITMSSTSNLFTVTNSTSLLTPATMMNSLPYSTITMSSTSNLVTVTTNTRVVMPVIAGVLPVCLLLLVLLIIIGSILACTLYRRRAKQKTERHHIDTQGQLSTLQRVENTYYAHIPIQSSDTVYSLVHEGNTETSHHNTVLPPPTYSSLATTQPHDANEQAVPPDYSVITLENILYGVGQSQNPVAPAGVGAGTLYSTVVRQDGEKVTVKMETSRTHTEEEEPGVQTAFNHDHTSFVKLTNSTSHVTEDEEEAQDMDYFDDPEILQQIRAQK